MFLGIDLGTSYLKGAVLDLATCQISHVRRVPFPEPVAGLPSLYREFDPAKVMSAVRSLLEILLPLVDHCEGILITGQMHGVVFTTSEGIAKSNLTTWQDQRDLLPHPSGEGSYLEVLRQRTGPAEGRQLGNELRSGLPIGLLFWYVESGQPLPSPDLIPAALPDFVIANLCHNEPVTDLTNAAAHCLLNLETRSWHHALIAKLGLQRFHLPAIKPHGTIVDRLDWHGQKIPIYTPIGDYQAALTGSLLQPHELSLNISTGSQASLLSDLLVFGDFQTRIYFDRQFTKTITNIPAGRALTALVALLSELATAQGITLDDPWSYIVKAAETVGSTGLQTNLSFFTSSIGDEGSITHIHEAELTVGHVFRSAFQSMAESYYTSALRLSPERAWQSLVFSGGLSQKIKLLRTLIADRFETTYRLSPHSEDTMLGLLVLATAFTDRANSVAQATQIVRDVLAKSPTFLA